MSNETNKTQYNSLSSTYTYQEPNDPPVITDLLREGNENIQCYFSLSDFTSHFSDPDADNLFSIQMTHLPDNGQLSQNDNPITINTDIFASDISNMIFTPQLDWAGTTSFTWVAFDGTDWSENSAKGMITIIADPVGIGAIIKSGIEDQYLEFDASDIGTFTLNSTSYIKCVSLPPNGTLLFDSQKTTQDHAFDGIPVYAGQEWHIYQLIGGELAMLPDPNFFGFTSFLWRASKNNEWSDDELVKITIAPVDDPPVVVNPLPDIQVDEDNAQMTFDLRNVFTDVDNDNSLMIYTLTGVSNPDVLTSFIVDNTLSVICL